ncbi:MAG: hypothetical protein AABW46_01760 [Nanoarchaeota archaeon]
MPLKSNVHIKLNNSDYLRKIILESALSSNQMQQSALKIKETQTEKRKVMSELKKRIQEISDLSKSIHLKEFPEFKAKVEKEEKIIVKKQPLEIQRHIEPAKSDKEKELIKELNDIKAKLDSISI